MRPDKPVGKGLVLTARDRQLLADIASFQVLTRPQIVALGHFRSKSRANARLARLATFSYLSRRYLPSVAGTHQALYYLGPHAAGLLALDRDELRDNRRRTAQLSDLFLAHQLCITDIRIAFQSRLGNGQFLRWLNEADLRALHIGVIPDGHVEYAIDGRQFGAFLEVDRGTEDLGRWTRKVQNYLLITKTDTYRQIFGRPYFRVLVISENDTRLRHLRQATGRLTPQIFWFTTLDRLLSEGPLTPIWRRPVDAASHALTES